MKGLFSSTKSFCKSLCLKYSPCCSCTSKTAGLSHSADPGHLHSSLSSPQHQRARPGQERTAPCPTQHPAMELNIVCAASSWSNLHRKAGECPRSTALPTATPGFTHQAQLTRLCHTCAKGPGMGSAHFSRQESVRKGCCSAERCRAPDRRSILSPSCCPLALISSPF